MPFLFITLRMKEISLDDKINKNISSSFCCKMADWIKLYYKLLILLKISEISKSITLLCLLISKFKVIPSWWTI